MNISNNIRSYLLLILYVLSGAHGAASHCQDGSHEHVEHSHNHEGHDHDGEGITFLHSVAHEIIHSFAHLIEHSTNDHECCDIALMVEVDTVKTASTPIASLANIWKPKSKFLPQKNIGKTYYITDHYNQIFLSLSSLRGPPFIV